MPVVYQCSHCSFTAKYPSHFKRHMLKHTGEKPFVCQVCDKAFSRKGSFKRHMLIHDNIKPHECDVCGEKFRHKSTLSKHMRIHTGERPYVCNICRRAFAQSGHLAKHMRSHANAERFRCDDCGKGYTTRGNLTRHRCTYANEDKVSASSDDQGECEYTCPLCNEVFKSLGTRNRHSRHCVDVQEAKPISPQKRDLPEPTSRSPKRARLLSHSRPSSPSSSSSATAPPPASASLADPHPCLYCSAIFPSSATRDAHELSSCPNRP